MNEETTFIYQQYLGGDNSNEMLGLAQTTECLSVMRKDRVYAGEIKKEWILEVLASCMSCGHQLAWQTSTKIGK